MKKVTNLSTNRILNPIYVLLFLMITWFPGFSQSIGINATGADPNAASGLDVDFPNKGVLIPRVALTGSANIAPLAAHVAGMLIYNTATAGDVTPGFYYDNGSKWMPAFPSGNAVGSMIYWNGTSWLPIPAGLPGQYLSLDAGGIPIWGGAAYATITTNAVTAITGISATSGGNIPTDGGSPVIARGICWSTTPNPILINSKTTDGSGIGAFVSSMTGLTPVTTYYVRAYSTNSYTTAYGNQVSFTTLPVLATITTTAATAITGTTATSGGNVTATGGASISERGIVYSTTLNPTIPGGANPGTKIISLPLVPGLGSFVSNITGLTGATTYHVRSYATNSAGTAYGADVPFTTLTIPPTLTTVAASNIGYSSATSGGSITWNGNGYSGYQNYGVAYATTPNSASPTLISTGSVYTPISTPLNPWTTNLSSLTPNTTYYIRSFIYAYSSTWGYTYGPELSFTTTAITTTPVSTVTLTTAVSGGSIGASVPTVASRGVCWNTSPGPTTGNFLTSDGTTTGTYVSNMTGLTGSTTYYVRAYYSDGVTTFYGNEYSFTTGVPKAIGDALAGGKVIYVDITGQHGLIGALVDQGSGVAWGCSGVSVPSTTMAQGGGALYAGLANTNAMIAAACNAPNGPAQLCAAYTAGGTGLVGITNWYLPSHDELQKLIDQGALVNITTTPSYAGAGVLYWASTEYNTSIAYAHYSLNGIYDYNVGKNQTYYSTPTNLMYVRAIRAF